ncbi:MAG: hypothetical protein WCR30_01820 [Clostridia bacterium]
MNNLSKNNRDLSKKTQIENMETKMENHSNNLLINKMKISNLESKKEKLVCDLYVCDNLKKTPINMINAIYPVEKIKKTHWSRKIMAIPLYILTFPVTFSGVFAATTFCAFPASISHYFVSKNLKKVEIKIKDLKKDNECLNAKIDALKLVENKINNEISIEKINHQTLDKPTIISSKVKCEKLNKNSDKDMSL